MTATQLQPMLTVDEVAELFGLHRVVVRLKCRRGEIPAVKVAANRWRIPRDWVETMLRGETPAIDPADHGGGGAVSRPDRLADQRDQRDRAIDRVIEAWPYLDDYQRRRVAQLIGGADPP